MFVCIGVRVFNAAQSIKNSSRSPMQIGKPEATVIHSSIMTRMGMKINIDRPCMGMLIRTLLLHFLYGAQNMSQRYQSYIHWVT